MSDSVWPHRQQPTRLPRPWDSPGKKTGVGCHFLLHCMKVKSEREVTQLCPTLRDPMDCSLPGSSVHGIFQAGVLEWGAIAFSFETWRSVKFFWSFDHFHSYECFFFFKHCLHSFRSPRCLTTGASLLKFYLFSLLCYYTVSLKGLLGSETT